MRWTKRWFGAALVAATVLATPGVAAAADVLVMDGSTTYEARPDAGVVRMSVDLSISNTKPDERIDGGVRYFYANGFRFPLPSAAANVVARWNGREVPVRITPTDDPELVVGEVDLPKNLLYRETQQWRIEADVVGRPPASDDPTRVNPAYLSFAAFPIGDPGKADVTVRVPEGFTVETVGAAVATTHREGQVVIEQLDIADPLGWFLLVSARDDAKLSSSDVAVGDVTYRLRSWPGHAAWVGLATDTIQRGVPVLEDLVGTPWPASGTIEVVESAASLLRGYDGSFDPIAKRIEVVDQLDQEVMLHELSHAWFNTTTFTERWISEGLAEAYAADALAELGGQPTAREPVTVTSAGAQPLSRWVDSAEAGEAEQYGYAASGQVMSALVDELGADAMADVLDAALEHHIAYAGDGDPEYAVTGSRELLDLLEEVGGSAQAETLFRDWVLDDAGDAKLAARAASCQRYHEVEERAGAWALPLGARRAMADWRFDDADALLAEVSAVLDQREAAQGALRSLGLELPASFERSFETARTQVADVGRGLDELRTTAAEVTRAQERLSVGRGLLATIGLWGRDPSRHIEAAVVALDAGDLEGARASAARATTEVGEAGDTGRARVLLAAGVLLALLVLIAAAIFLLVRHRRRRRAAPPGEDTVDDAVEPDAAEVEPPEVQQAEADAAEDIPPLH